MDNESKLRESASSKNPIPVYVLPCTDKDDEISLLDIWRVIVARKYLILSSLLVSIIFATVYLYLAEPLYRAEAYLLPPQQQDIQGLLVDYSDQGSLELKKYTPELVYEAFLSNLKSQGLRRKFFDNNKLSSLYSSRENGKADNFDQVFDGFNASLTVQVDNQNPTLVTAGYSYHDPQLAAQWINQFITFANEYTVDQLINVVNIVIRTELEQVHYQLERELKLAEQKRQDSIIGLQEALRIARMLGIENASMLSMATEKRQSGISFNMAKPQLYMRGTKALETEIAVLESRKSDEPFIEGLRGLQEKYVFLKNISVDSEALSAVKIDSEARVPYRPEKPRKKLVMILAGVLGLMIGIFLIFIAELWSKAHN